MLTRFCAVLSGNPPAAGKNCLLLLATPPSLFAPLSRAPRRLWCELWGGFRNRKMLVLEGFWRRRRETNARFSSVEIQGFTVRSFPFWLLSCTTLLYRFQPCRPAAARQSLSRAGIPPALLDCHIRRKITDAGRRRPSFASRVERIRLITWKVRGSNPLPARLTRAVI